MSSTPAHLPDDAIGRARKYTDEEKRALEEQYRAMRSRPTLGSTVVSQPEPHHRCGPNRYGYWIEHGWDAPGTVRECQDCGRTWVSIPSGQLGVLVNRWRREGRIERWRRERRMRVILSRLRSLLRCAEPRPPLLDERQMQQLYEDIFEEPVSAEWLLTKYAAVPPAQRRQYEWVMDAHTWQRIRRLNAPSGGPFVYPMLDGPKFLLGLPVVIEPFAKLALRQREPEPEGL